MSIEMGLLKRMDPASGTVPSDGREELLANLRAGDVAAQKPARRRAAVIATVTGAAVAATGGFAFALLAQSPTTALKINCSAGVSQSEFYDEGGFTSVIDNVTGDPAADCASGYAALGEQPPALQAYDVGASYIYVVPTDWRVPEAWRALPSGFRSDTTRLALKQRIDDPVDGPSAICRTDAQAEQLVRNYWDELGLTGWVVEPAPGWSASDGVQSCAFAILDESGLRTVYIQMSTAWPEPGDTPEERAYVDLRQLLREGISARCLSMAEAKAVAEAALADSGIDGVVRTIAAEAGRCTAVDLVTGGGPFQVVLS
jgi:hypothetical protein